MRAESIDFRSCRLRTDWAGFCEQTAQLGSRVQIVGDDLYVTNTALIRRGIVEQSTNAVLIKLNQIGTVTETIAAVELCREAGWRFVVSHRSGETEDPFIADLACRDGRRPDKDRFALPQRTHCQILSAARNRVRTRTGGGFHERVRTTGDTMTMLPGRPLGVLIRPVKAWGRRGLYREHYSR